MNRIIRPNKKNVVFPVSRPGWKKTCRISFLGHFTKILVKKLRKSDNYSQSYGIFHKMFIFSSLGLNLKLWGIKEETPPKRVKFNNFFKPNKNPTKKKKILHKKRRFFDLPGWNFWCIKSET